MRDLTLAIVRHRLALPRGRERFIVGRTVTALREINFDTGDYSSIANRQHKCYGLPPGRKIEGYVIAVASGPVEMAATHPAGRITLNLRSAMRSPANFLEITPAKADWPGLGWDWLERPCKELVSLVLIEVCLFDLSTLKNPRNGGRKPRTDELRLRSLR